MFTMHRFWKTCQRSLLVTALALVPVAAQAAVPSQVTLEGALLSTGGGAAPDGTYNVVFAIYKDVSGGNPIWSEGPVAVAVKNGLFQYSIGSKTALTPAALANLATAFLGMKVEADAELPRQQLLSTAYALRAGIAEGVDCSGCIGAAALDPNVLAAYAKATDLAAYAKTTDLGAYAKTASLKPVATTGAYSDLSGLPVLAPVATSGKYSDLSGGPDLTPYVKASALKAVATTGAYADLSGAPVLAKVATTGSYVDLANLPVAVTLGTACGTGLVMKGIKADGSYDCGAGGGGPIDVKNLPADGIDEISNGLIFNQFNDTFAGIAGTKIPDNNPGGAVDTITYPDIGLSQKLTVTLDVANSDISHLNITLTDPNMVDYVLYKSGATGTAIKTSYPAPTLPVSGDLTTWVGKNPAGKWTIKVVDTIFLNNTFDGAINSWSITSQTLSSKKIAVAGNLGVAGNLNVTGATTVSDITFTGTLTGLNWGWTYRTGVCNGYDNAYGWQNGNDANMCLGVAPSQWSNGYYAYQISPDKDLWRMNFLTGGRAKSGGHVIDTSNTQYGDSNMSQHAFALFRIKNTTGSAINWAPTYYFTTGGGWTDYSSATLNGANSWTNTSNCYGNCTANPTFSIPANRTSTVIFAVSSSLGWAPANFYDRRLQLSFTKGSLTLASGLQFIDDLDTATGGWEQ